MQVVLALFLATTAVLNLNPPLLISNMLTMPRVPTCSTQETFRTCIDARKFRTVKMEACQSYHEFRTSVKLAIKSLRVRGYRRFRGHMHSLELHSFQVATLRIRSFTQVEWVQAAIASLRIEIVP